MGWDELSPQARARSETIRGDKGEELYLDQDLLVRQAFTGGRAHSRQRPGPGGLPGALPDPGKSRRPLLAWARQMPLGGEPAGLVTRIEAYDAWLEASPASAQAADDLRGLADAAHHPGDGGLVREPHLHSLEIAHCGKAGHHAARGPSRRDRRRHLGLGGTCHGTRQSKVLMSDDAQV